MALEREANPGRPELLEPITLGVEEELQVVGPDGGLAAHDVARGQRELPEPHEDPQGDATARLLAQARAVRWRGHPAWFDRIHKGLLPQLPLPADERCAPLAQWRALGRPAEALVLKSARSWGGAGLRLQVDAAELDALASTADAPHWIVQPRYQAFPLATARDGAPLYGELRCMLALPPDGPPWIAARLARLSRGPMASARGWSGKPGEGLAPVYAPPGAGRIF